MVYQVLLTKTIFDTSIVLFGYIQIQYGDEIQITMGGSVVVRHILTPENPCYTFPNYCNSS